MSGQYSSRRGSEDAAVARVTGLPSPADIISGKRASSEVTLAPSGSVTRTGGRGSPSCGGAVKAARKSNMVGHFFGFFALTTFPVSVSTRAIERSPSTPRSVTSDAFSSSPIIDLTGYRHNERTAPSAIVAPSLRADHRTLPPIVHPLALRGKGSLATAAAWGNGGSAVPPDLVDVEGPCCTDLVHADAVRVAPVRTLLLQVAEQLVFVRAPFAVVAAEDDDVVDPSVPEEL